MQNAAKDKQPPAIPPPQALRFKPLIFPKLPPQNIGHAVAGNLSGGQSVSSAFWWPIPPIKLKEDINLDTVCVFNWSRHWEFHLTTKEGGTFQWNCPDFGGDNTIVECESYDQWLIRLNITEAIYRGEYKIRDYCGETVIIK